MHVALKASGIESTYSADQRSIQKYLVFENLEQAKLALPVISKHLSSTCTAAQTAGYTSIKLNDTFFSYIHIKNASLEDVRKEILHDETQYEYTCELVISEFHAYIKITNLKTGEYICPSSSVKPFGSASGEMFIRDDKPYHSKYYRGDEIIDFSSKNSKRDKSSLSIKFMATKEKVKKLEDIVKEYKEKYTPGNQEYVFFTNNCHVFANKLFKAIEPNVYPIEFARADSLDLSDKGPHYQVYTAYGPWTATASNLLSTFELVMNEGSSHIPKTIYNVLHKLYVKTFYSFYDHDAQDAYGNTMLMNSIIHENISEAMYLLDKGIDANIKNNKGEIALHIASALPASEEKIELIKKLVEVTDNINVTDLYDEYTPLSFAVISNDTDVISYLIENGANPHYINAVGDNLGNIASYFAAKESAKTLYAIDPEILHFDNMTRQYPIFHEDLIHEDFAIPTHISPKEEDALYCKMKDVESYFELIY
ncbi:MAG: ankyrin repeat domain-containing protein [Alphaproteobacteria bacterium]|jgi:ankyrin repeat protein|nr:ankyrin repeat domain-containing protein [Candidatus Jidaibacter sp.]